MDYQDYVQLTEKASQLLASSKYKEAEDVLYSLLMSDVSDVDKANLCLQMAIVHDRTGNSEEVLSWYDKGMGYEQPLCRYAVALEKARYLADLGHCTEAVPIYEELLKQAYVGEAEKDNFRKEIRVLLSRAIGQWK